MKKTLIIPIIIVLIAIFISVILLKDKKSYIKEKSDIIKIIENNENIIKILRMEDIPVSLPQSVRTWLITSGCIDSEVVTSAKIYQTFYMKMNEEQESWDIGSAEQIFSISEPAFLWSLDIKMNNIIPVKGRDLFISGKGSMLIKLLSILPVVNINDNQKIDESTMHRFLGELMWFPTAALSPYISWKEIDKNIAEATMTWNGISVTGRFIFDTNGDIKRFEANRYKDIEDELPTLWIGEVLEINEINKKRIPTKASISWKTEDTSWTWAIINIDSILYNNVEDY